MSVFVVQHQHRWDAALGRLVPKFDLAPAEQWGQLLYLLGPTASPFNPGVILPELHQKLQTFTDDDSLLCIGNPCLIGFATAVAAYWNQGRVQMLQWSGKDQSYVRVVADLAEFTPKGVGVGGGSARNRPR